MSPIIRKFLVLLLLLTTLYSNSQLEFSKWYFGNNAGLDFSSSPPTLLTNGSLISAEGCATVCDNSGNLLFYCSPVTIYNSTHATMANGNGLLGHVSSSQGAIIVKQPGNNTIYYVFTLSQYGAANSANYSIVDMSLAAGLGSVTVKNANLYTAPACEKHVAIRHCNGNDVWMLSHEYGTNNFRAYLLTTTGITTNPVISSVGETISGNTSTPIGQLKISPDGRKLAMTTNTSSTPSNLGGGGFQLFDFDAATGVVSNSLVLNSATWSYGIEFSPDGTKLYGANSVGNGTIIPALFQWNVCAGNNAAIIASQYTINLGNIIGGSLQRAIDGKIYLAFSGTQSISVINNPNAVGAAMGFSINALSVAPKLCILGFPNYINPYTKPTVLPFSKTISCQSVNFTAPGVPTFTSGCSPTPYSPNGYLWDFGEPSSGANNTSTLSNPSHVFASTGIYTVSLILVNPCVNDTIKQTVTIVSLAPNPAVAGPTLICKGDRYTYTASGGSSYLWSNASTATAQALSPTLTSVYTVSATTNGCTVSKTFTITVNPCLGIVHQDVSTGFSISFKVFPNPVNDELTVESSVPSSLIIFDLNGKMMLDCKLNFGTNQINTACLKAGVYSILIQSEFGTYRTRLIKVE